MINQLIRSRLLEGVRLKEEPMPDSLILDGQQRLTSAYMCLRSGSAVIIRDRQYQCKQTATGESIESMELTQRLFVEFNGLTRGYNYIFEVNCDDRQIDRFEQFLNDHRSLPEDGSKEKYSSSLFTLRSAHLLWDRNESQDRHRHDIPPIETAILTLWLEMYLKIQKQHQISSEIHARSFIRFIYNIIIHRRAIEIADEPWNTHQLYLHCAIETKSLTAEGMREIQQQKIQKVNNTLTKQSINTNPSIGQQQSQRRNQTSQSLLDRSLPRPSRPNDLRKMGEFDYSAAFQPWHSVRP